MRLICGAVLGLLLLGCGADDNGNGSNKGDAAAAKIGTVSGKVVCSCNATKTIPNVTVSTGSKSTQSAGQGSYKLEGVPTGKQTITATGSPFHNDYSQQIVVSEGANQHDVVMDLK